MNKYFRMLIMNPALLFSLLKRLIGVGLLVLNYLSYGLMIKLAADPSLLAIERIIYPTLIWLIGWVFVIVKNYSLVDHKTYKPIFCFVYALKRYARLMLI